MDQFENKYEILQELGCGNFAKVYLALDLETQELVALKLVNKEELVNEKAYERTRLEMANIKKLSGHKNLVNLFETFETNTHFGISMEYVPGGDLFEFIRTQEGMAESDAKDLFRGILEGVKHCHDNGIAHRDLKLENILLDKDGSPKIADFGFSKKITSQPLIASSVGSLLYSSPEIIEGMPYQGNECDMWSLGVILYVMLTASMPFDDSNMGSFLKMIAKGSYPEPIGLSDSVRDLIHRMLNPDKDTRYTMQQVLSHPWLTARSGNNGKYIKRRNGVCYKSADAIRYALVSLNQCDCSCHKADSKCTSRDSVISRHCADCDDVQANDTEVMMRRQIKLSRNSSSVSSGYGSELGGSQYLRTPSPNENQQLLGCDLCPILGRRSSVPRKSSASSASTVKAKTSQKRCSVPARCREYASGEEDIVFV